MQFILKKKVILILGCLLITGAGIYAAQWKWHFWKPKSVQNSPAAVINPVENADAEAAELSNESAGVREILSAHLFGQEAEAVKQASHDSGSVLKTQQPLELRGIIFIPQHPERTVALIAPAGGAAMPYKTGEELKPALAGWSVSLILPESVRIKQEGMDTEELLELPQNTILLNNPNPVLTSPVGQANNMSASTEMPVEEQPPPDEIPMQDPALDNAPPVDEMPPENLPPAQEGEMPAQNPVDENAPPVDPVQAVQE
jgi:hypothetical protein